MGIVAILGNGRSGVAAARLLESENIRCVVYDRDDEIDFSLGFGYADVSPGVPGTHRWIKECTDRGIPIKSELQLGCEALKRRGWKLFAITGSKGKSSVVKAVADTLSLSCKYAVACGNYGVPVSEVALMDRRGGVENWAIVEVSSFQMEHTILSPNAFEAAAILNLQEDHLDRHGSVEVYHNLKKKLLKFSPISIFGDEMPVEKKLFSGSYFDNSVLEKNGFVAQKLLKLAGLGDDEIERGFSSFVPLDHRMKLVAEINSVKYIDDSKATSLAALAAGVEIASKLGSGVLLIAGGLAKGDDPKTLKDLLTKRVKKVYLIGDCAEAFFDSWKDCVSCEISMVLENAVKSAKRDVSGGDVVLLSPGCASYDQFKNFEVRGETFAKLVKKEG